MKKKSDDGNTVVTALVNKFEAAIKQGYSNEKDNIFLFIDEGHGTQYGKLNIYVNKILPNAAKIIFTGTPLLKQPKNSGKEALESAQNNYLKFGPLIDKYTLQDAIDDRVTVPIIYEGRVIPQNVTSKRINEHLKHITVSLADGARKELEERVNALLSIQKSLCTMLMPRHFTTQCAPG